ncbi:hypothetical protein ACHAQK_007637, partial [Fusarium lateritium]
YSDVRKSTQVRSQAIPSPFETSEQHTKTWLYVPKYDKQGHIKGISLNELFGHKTKDWEESHVRPCGCLEENFNREERTITKIQDVLTPDVTVGDSLQLCAAISDDADGIKWTVSLVVKKPGVQSVVSCPQTFVKPDDKQIYLHLTVSCGH